MQSTQVSKCHVSFLIPPFTFRSYYRPKRSFGQGNIFTPVCHSLFTGGGGVPDQAPPRPGTQPPPRDHVHPPGPGTHPPGTRYTPRDQVHPPGPGAPPPEQQPPEYGQRSAGTHPTGMHSCFQIFLL